MNKKDWLLFLKVLIVDGIGKHEKLTPKEINDLAKEIAKELKKK